MKSLTARRARKLLSYNKSTGALKWQCRTPNNPMKVGQVAGSVNHDGYRAITVDGGRYQAHRVIWLIVRGRWPAYQIDHRNHIRGDNRWRNLKEDTDTENKKNKALQKNNTSGVTGVHLKKATGKWYAQIRANGRQIHLGYFTNKKEAIKARKKAEKKYGFHPNHGKKNPQRRE